MNTIFVSTTMTLQNLRIPYAARALLHQPSIRPQDFHWTHSLLFHVFLLHPLLWTSPRENRPSAPCSQLFEVEFRYKYWKKITYKVDFTLAHSSWMVFWSVEGMASLPVPWSILGVQQVLPGNANELHFLRFKWINLLESAGLWPIC